MHKINTFFHKFDLKMNAKTLKNYLYIFHVYLEQHLKFNMTMTFIKYFLFYFRRCVQLLQLSETLYDIW